MLQMTNRHMTINHARRYSNINERRPRKSRDYRTEPTQTTIYEYRERWSLPNACIGLCARRGTCTDRGQYGRGLWWWPCSDGVAAAHTVRTNTICGVPRHRYIHHVHTVTRRTRFPCVLGMLAMGHSKYLPTRPPTTSLTRQRYTHGCDVCSWVVVCTHIDGPVG